MSAAVEGGERGGPVARRAGIGVALLLFLGLLLIPDLPLTGIQRRVAATSAATATLWITVAIPVGAASLLPAVLFPCLGVMSAAETAPIYMRDLVLLFIGAFIIALGLERWGVHRRMALGIIGRVGTSRRRLVLGFMIAAGFLSMWINNTATTLLMLPIATAVIASVDDTGAPSAFSLSLLLGIAYSASVGGMGTPVGTAPNQEFLGQFADRFPNGPRLSFGDWFFAWSPLVVLFVPIAWLLLTRVLLRVESPPRGDAGERRIRETLEAEREDQGPMNRPQRLMLGVFVTTAVLWITRADLVFGELRIPGWSRLLLDGDAGDAAWYRANKNYVSDSTVATIMALACFFIPAERGRGTYLMDWRTAARLPWEVILLLGGGFCLARGFRVSGLDEVLGGLLSPLLSGHSSWFVVGAVVLLMSLLTELTSNTATTAVLLPVVASAAVEAGMDPLLVMAPATIAASAAFMLPVATPPNAVVFSSRLVPIPSMVRTGFWLNLTCVLLITCIFQLWVRRLWNIDVALPAWARP